MNLTIVIPVLNEEEAIGITIQRCQASVSKIVAQTSVEEVEIVVVSDGSTDRTVEIAKSFAGIQVVVFEENRGYGAAIKAGWELGQGNLLAFLDGDGTCSPDYFVDMCLLIEKEDADVVLGSRMGKNSKMPKVRRLGNTLFAMLLKFLSKKNLTDSASGMRVVKRSSLNQILPLPDGLHFTPAISARVLMDRHLKIAEIDMDYEERIGRSKLSAIKDGLQFLKVILSTALYIRPSSLSIPLSVVIFLFGLVVAAYPVQYYFNHGAFQEKMIYRFILLFLMGNVLMTILCATIIAEHTIALTLLRYNRYIGFNKSWWAPNKMKIYLTVAGVFSVIALALIFPALLKFVETGNSPPLHWSRMMFSGFLFLDFIQLLVTALLIRIIDSLNDRQAFLVKNEGSSYT